MGRKFYLFLYGTPNIVACCLGLAGLAMYFGGAIKEYWFFIVAGLYALGLVATPNYQTIELAIERELSVDDMQRAMENLVDKIRKHVAKEILDKVVSIKDTIAQILPRINDIQNSDYDAHVIEQTAMQYLPSMLQTYLNLPKAFARFHSVKEGKTPREILLEQLDILDREMQSILVNILENDTQALIGHGRFLKEKFAKTAEQWF